jgi:hypothetical protein
MQIERCARGEVGGNVPALAVAALSWIPTPTRAIVGPDMVDGRRHRVPRRSIGIEIQIYPEVVGNWQWTDVLDGYCNMIGLS